MNAEMSLDDDVIGLMIALIELLMYKQALGLDFSSSVSGVLQMSVQF